MDEEFNKVFDRQKEFQKLLGNDTTTQEFKNQMFLGLFEESAELMKETPFKKHKKKQVFNEDKFLEECVDVQIYLANLVISTGCTANDFIRRIKEKQDTNFKRQKDGY